MNNQRKPNQPRINFGRFHDDYLCLLLTLAYLKLKARGKVSTSLIITGLKKTIFLASLIVICSLSVGQAETLVYEPDIHIEENNYLSYSLLETHYDGTVKGDSVYVTAKYKIRVLDDKRTNIAILPKDAAIMKVDLPKNVLLLTNPNNYSLLFSQKGEYQVSVYFAYKTQQRNGKNAL